MRIANILFDHASPGALIVDLTRDAVSEDVEHELPPGHIGSTVREPPGEGEVEADCVLWLRQVDPETPPDPPILEGAGPDDRQVIHVIFARSIEHFIEMGLVEDAAERGLEIASLHMTEKRALRFAAVLKAAAPDARDRTRLRLVNEHRVTRALLRWLDDEVRRSRATEEEATSKLSGVRSRAEQAERERASLAERLEAAQEELQHLRAQRAEAEESLLRLRREHAATVDELARSRTSAERTAERLQEELAGREHHEARAEQLEAELDRVFHRLRRSRQAVTFRVGRATTKALRASRKNPLTLPVSWISAFRSEDEIVAELDPARLRREEPIASPSARAGIDVAAVERDYFLTGVELGGGPGPCVAGVVGPRLARELAAATRFHALTPNAWRHVLEADPPSYVLVTRDGLAPGSAWGQFGTPAGKDGAAELSQLLAWCHARSLPVAYWDTLGKPAPRLGLPMGLSFDAAFSVSARRCADEVPGARQVEHLLPGVELLVHSPVGRPTGKPSGVIFAGSFDRRSPRDQLEILAALLRAAPSGSLEIFDAMWGYQGAAAAAVRFPDDLVPATQPRPSVEAEARAMRAAGVVIASNAVSEADFPAWQALRGLASGAHVVSTPAALDDPRLASSISWAVPDTDHAALFERLVDKPVLSDDAAVRVLRHVAGRYDLRDRLDRIAAHFGVPAVARPRAAFDVVAQPSSEEEANALADWVQAQTTAPRSVRVVASEGVDPDALRGRVSSRVVPVSHVRDIIPRSGSTDATHLYLWDPGRSDGADVLGHLADAARWSDAEIVAVAGDPGANGPRIPFGYSSRPDIAAAAVRVDAMQDRPLPQPSSIVPALLSEGARQFVALTEDA